MSWAPPTLNLDLGELPDEPPELARLAGMVNVACGAHAGDEATMAAVIARAPGIVCAHPSYPDREGFGRRRLPLGPAEVEATVAEQCARLRAVAVALGRAVEAVKPHGALYHAADGDPTLAEALVRGAGRALGPVAVVGPWGGCLAEAAARAGLPYLVEELVDRGRAPDGTLLPRGAPGAVLVDPEAVAARARELAGSCDTLCVHGDNPNAVAVARAVAAVLDALPVASPSRLPPGAPLRVPLADLALPAGAEEALAADPRVRDVVVTDQALAVWGDVDEGAVRALLARAALRAAAPREHVLAVRYDGADLGWAAARAGVSPAALVARHAETAWTVRFVGFQPGFAYLEAPDWPWVFPRLPAPRPVVPAGAVGLAGARCGVYPDATPGGWRLVGRALDVALFDVDHGALLRRGDRVRFVPA